MDERDSPTSEAIHWASEIMISKAGGRSMQDPEQAELPRRSAQAVVSPRGMCNQWNYFLLTTASTLTTNDNFDKLASPWRRKDFTTTVSMVQELFWTLRKFPLWNKSWSEWYGQVMQNAGVEPARRFPRQRPHLTKTHVTSLSSSLFRAWINM